MNVPGDLSVCGFDDSILASRSYPTLTTIRRPVKEMARLATAKLIASIDGREDDARTMDMVTPYLVPRESTAAIK
jgi:LacI family transcriptional regulator